MNVEMGLRPRNSQNRNKLMGFSLQCISLSVYHGISGLLIRGQAPCKVANYTHKILDEQSLTPTWCHKRLAKKDQRVFIPVFQL
jgi:hypothetical protein